MFCFCLFCFFGEGGLGVLRWFFFILSGFFGVSLGWDFVSLKVCWVGELYRDLFLNCLVFLNYYFPFPSDVIYIRDLGYINMGTMW